MSVEATEPAGEVWVLTDPAGEPEPPPTPWITSEPRCEREEWTAEHEHQMNKWKLEAKERSRLHHVKSKRLSRLKHISLVTSVVASSTMGILNGLSESPDDGKYRSANVILSFTVTGLSMLGFKFKFGENSLEHADASRRYDNFVSLIDYQMSKSREFRREVVEFYTEIQNRFINLTRISPSVSFQEKTLHG